eukprot:2695254-Prymnesium_polylepis.1
MHTRPTGRTVTRALLAAAAGVGGGVRCGATRATAARTSSLSSELILAAVQDPVCVCYTLYLQRCTQEAHTQACSHAQGRVPDAL